MNDDSHISALVGAARSPVTWLRTHFAKLIRYAAVSVVSTITTLTVLGLLVGVFRFPAAWSNVIATCAATIPSFELNRRWVWTRRGDRSFLREMAPFAGLSFTGLVISTLNVHLVGLWATSAGWSGLLRTGAIEVTNVGTFGCLWVFQYVLCDRFLFRPPAPAQSPASPIDPAAAVFVDGPAQRVAEPLMDVPALPEGMDQPALTHGSSSTTHQR